MGARRRKGRRGKDAARNGGKKKGVSFWFSGHRISKNVRRKICQKGKGKFDHEEDY